LPKDKKFVSNKWVFKIKYNLDGNISKYKAHLVAKRFTQIVSLDFEEIFSPIVKINSKRILLTLAAHFDFEVHQFDIKTTFLHGILHENIYMK